MNISKISQNYNNIYAKPISENRKVSIPSVSFKAVVPKQTLYSKFTDNIAKGLAWLLHTKPAQKLVEKTKNTKNLFSHLIVVGSALLSSFYIIKTLKNDKLDNDRKRTLAINQGIVFVASTVMAYSFDNLVSKKTGKIIDKYKTIKKQALDKQILTLEQRSKALQRIERQAKGIDAAKKIMIFDSMYRFIAPVLVTPIANAIGNRVNEKK